MRLASQAVQPSQNIVAYRPWSGRYAPCFSPTSPRFIRHRRRFGDVARTRSSSGAFAGECAELPTEICKLSTAARRCGCRAGTARLLFFCRRFLFQIKRKCRNAGSIYRLIMVCSEGRNQLATIQPSYNFVSASPISDSRKGCPYEVRCLKSHRF